MAHKIPNIIVHGIMPGFMAIGQTIAEIWQFFDFQNSGHLFLGFIRFRILTADGLQMVKMHYLVEFCDIWSNHC